MDGNTAEGDSSHERLVRMADHAEGEVKASGRRARRLRDVDVGTCCAASSTRKIAAASAMATAGMSQIGANRMPCTNPKRRKRNASKKTPDDPSRAIQRLTTMVSGPCERTL